MTDLISALIAEYEHLTDIVVALEEHAGELRRALPVHLRGPAYVRLGGKLFFAADDIEAYELDDEEAAAAGGFGRLPNRCRGGRRSLRRRRA
jgi:hypothetical protein